MKKKVYDVIIIGAGIAGLSAALEAKKQGLSYIVIDARARAGGRIFSKKLKGGLVVELGAEWIGKTHKDLLSFCRTYGVALKLHRFTDVRYYGRDNKPAAGFQELLKKFEEVVSKQKESNIPPSINTYDFLEKSFSEEELRVLSRIYGPDFATHLRYVSAKDAFRELQTGGQYDHMDYQIKGGNTKLIEVLYKEVVKRNVRLGEPVEEIVDGEIIEVNTSTQSYKAQKVLVTVGLQQLKHMKISPSLNEKRQQARRLSYGDITKAFISFKGDFPNKKQKLIFYSESDIPCVYVTTQGQSEKKFALCVYAVGAAAKKIAKMKRETFVKKVLHVLPRDVFDVESLAVEDVFMQHWGAEQYSKGAYCIFNPDEHAEITRSFGVAHGNIYFAGDYLGNMFNYMNGAFQSGRDTMRNIAKSLK